MRNALRLLPGPPVGYGKAAIVGLDGDIEHAAAIIHPRMGKPIRDAIGGGKAIIPSNVKVAAAGTAIDVPLADRDDVWLFDNIDTLTVAVPDAPRPREIVVVVALADGGRPRPRVDKDGARPVTVGEVGKRRAGLTRILALLPTAATRVTAAPRSSRSRSGCP